MTRDPADKSRDNQNVSSQPSTNDHGQRSFLEDLSPSRLPANIGQTFSTRAPSQTPHVAVRPKPVKSSSNTKPDLPHAGHRQRLRERFSKTGPEGLPDYELLELVLFRVIPRRDTKDLAKRLIKAFGSFAGVISASSERLLEIEDVTEGILVEFRILQATSLRLAKGEFARKDLLSSWEQVLTYLRLAQAYADREHFRILFLDKRNVLIADEIQGSGTVDHTPVYVREVVKRALVLSASAVILVHNHPSGDPTPSRADIDMTKMIVDTLRPLGISVHDHVIVGRQGHASLKAMRLM
jgi:DNA repair protein RadC